MNIETQTDIPRHSFGTQTEWSNTESDRQRIERNTTKEITEALLGGKGFEGIAGQLDKTWPEKLYKKTEIDSVAKANQRTGDQAYLLDLGVTEQNLALELFTSMHSELKEIVTKNEGQPDYIIKTVATRTKNQATSEKTTAIYILPLTIDLKGVNNPEDVYNILKELKNTMHVHDTPTLNLILGEGLNTGYVRKICEYVFSDTEVKIALLTFKDKQKPKINKTNRNQKEKVIVKCEKMEYAELLKTVKEKVDIDRLGVRVKTIRKSTAGDLILEVDGDRQKAAALKEVIGRKTEQEVRLINNLVTLHVLDLDATNTTSTVENVVKNLIGLKEPQLVRVKSLRPTRDGNQIATLQVCKQDAKYLMGLGRIRIGWVNCRLRERMNIPRCYKCLEFGHRTRECKGEDRSDLCLNCMKPGHKAKECRDTHHCLVCGTSDHRADTTKCPRFRELMRAQMMGRSPTTKRMDAAGADRQAPKQKQ